MGENPTREDVLKLIEMYINMRWKERSNPEITNRMLKMVAKHNITMEEFLFWMDNKPSSVKGYANQSHFSLSRSIGDEAS